MKRRADADDQRINRLFLTPKGVLVLHRVSRIGRALDARVMRGVPVARQKLLAHCLHAMKANLVALDAVPGSKTQSRG